MGRKIYLDLEQTVIDNWQDGQLYKPHRVRTWLNALFGDGPREVSIFSFAIYNAADKLVFERDLKHALELTFEIKIVEWMSVEEMIKASQQYTGNKWYTGKDITTLDIIDYLQLKGKVGAFEDVCMAQNQKGVKYILLDDVVPRKTIIYHDHDVRIDYYNVDRLQLS